LSEQTRLSRWPKTELASRAIEKMEHVAECHHVAGDDDYLLKVRCRGTQDLDHLLAHELKDKLGVARTRTTIVLSTAKESVRVPIDHKGDAKD
jgi:Lrp/AsnC family transcriptional regulator, leucine-responsive regulatory protein